MSAPLIALNSGCAMPAIGFGTCAVRYLNLKTFV